MYEDRDSIWSIPPNLGWFYFLLFTILSVSVMGYVIWLAVAESDNPYQVLIAVGKDAAPWIIVNAGVSLIATNLLDWTNQVRRERRLIVTPEMRRHVSWTEAPAEIGDR